MERVRLAGDSGNGYFDLGTYGRRVNTSSAEAQLWFDRGLNWCYAFNHEEAIRCFERSAEADPDCALAHWGLAYAAGCNYNKPWEAFLEEERESALRQAHGAVGRAAAAIEAAGPEAWPAEARLVSALRRRYPQPETEGEAPWQAWNDRYAAAMREVYAEEPGDVDVAALRAADALRDLVPDAGHLRHMASHIDVLCGNYRDSLTANERAIDADDAYFGRVHDATFYSLYRCHNIHFKIYSALFLGQLGPALEGARQLEVALPESLLRVEVPPMADWLEGFLSMRVHALIRFGRWHDVLALPMPEDPELHCVTTAMLRYARGVALAALGDVPAARGEQREFAAAWARVPGSRTIFNNTCLDILGVAALMLEGEILYRAAEHDLAFEALREAVALADGLPYDEPWAWMQPVRHALGALLLERGRVEDALVAYREDLGLEGSVPRALQQPDNVWSLHGLVECLERLGRGAEAEPYRQRLALALARTDVPVQSSCFCRLEAHGAHKGLHEHERHGHGHQGHDHIAGAGEDHSCH